ncbi:MAG: hypothetical protein GC168_15685 [Candidatus Hydrogenedens sp.]|nr:hypothetical protein [Candidatus Hydrogenedens sp.]
MNTPLHVQRLPLRFADCKPSTYASFRAARVLKGGTRLYVEFEGGAAYNIDIRWYLSQYTNFSRVKTGSRWRWASGEPGNPYDELVGNVTCRAFRSWCGSNTVGHPRLFLYYDSGIGYRIDWETVLCLCEPAYFEHLPGANPIDSRDTWRTYEFPRAVCATLQWVGGQCPRILSATRDEDGRSIVIRTTIGDRYQIVFGKDDRHDDSCGIASSRLRDGGRSIVIKSTSGKRAEVSIQELLLKGDRRTLNCESR